MKFWRMSFRAGNHGYEMWPDCLKLGVAAITYHSLTSTDLSKYPQGQPKKLWKELKPSQKASLRRVAYEMRSGDVIYVKQGPQIVDRGIVTGSYRFDSHFRLADPNGVPWAHQVSVDWSREFKPITMLLGAEQLTVKELSAAEVEQLKAAEGGIGSHGGQSIEPKHPEAPGAEPLVEDAYYRETPARLKVIVPRHNKLSNDFCRWLEKEHKIGATQEKQRVDIRFKMRRLAVLAELKICFGVGTTRSIREALGQLLEYNHYVMRKPADEWLIVLDDEPSESDRRYIGVLRERRTLPITLGWRSKVGFSFHPKWPV
jgi:hypothetical protein